MATHADLSGRNRPAEERRAVIILSGGLDSATCLGIAAADGYRLYALTFDYGQRHAREIESAGKLAAFYRAADHRIAGLPFFRDFGSSALTDERIAVPKEGVNPKAIPVTYVPGRNLIFLAVAAAYAETVGASAVFIGVNALDYSGYPDCRPEFVDAFARAARLATRAGVGGSALAVETPLLRMTKAEIIRRGRELGVPYELTTSCYEGAAVACGRCDSCRLRLRGFAEAGLADPIPYALA